MRIIKPEELNAAQFAPNEAFLIELWYSMTHQKSLDSYRAKCMNSRMLLRELAEELAIGIIKPCDLKGVCAETDDVLTADPVIKGHFPNLFNRILPFLRTPPQADEKYKKDDDKGKEFIFIANDFSASLEKRYWESSCSVLLDALDKGDLESLKIVMSNIIADLIDKGWPIETLFSWHNHFLSPEVRKQYSFNQNLKFMLEVFSNESQQFEVTLRLTGSENLKSLGEFHNFTFVDVPKNLGEKAPPKFKTANKIVCFAQTTVNDSDFLSAAINAKESFEQFIDLLRFDYEPYSLKIDQLCHVKRISDGKIVLPVVKTVIPNPNSNSDHSTFMLFMEGLKALSEKRSLEESTRRKIRGAIRQYRFGRDSENYKDKFLNWWMGLEAVAHIGRGNSIGEVVSYNVSRVMVLPYLARLLGDVLTTMKYGQVGWQPELKAFCSGKELQDLTSYDLLSIIQSDPQRTKLLQSFERIPTLHFRAAQLFPALIDPAETLSKIEAHLHHLEWQMARLYRIRCCVVHGSDVRFRIGLFAANLEFYLKETVKYLIYSLCNNGHVKNLDEVYSRASISYYRTVERLKQPDAGLQEIKDAIFNNNIVLMN
ncbi:MAG TPA: hypothetical protein VI298_09395 [Geobacteraceae bacterium]